ncbi:hypothetical protein [Halobacteriovorax sp.]|uniref:hypothetical protein n=1 Tax=Halobacteriovorax sp. TaxID=2020862 RepID=UPI003568E07C
MIFTILTSLVTYEFSKLRYVGAIRASSIVGICIYFICLEFESLEPSLLFGGTFVGMCSSNRINRLELVLATLVYFFALSFLKSYFNGVGGLLGMSSFIGVSSVLLLSVMHKKVFSYRSK